MNQTFDLQRKKIDEENFKYCEYSLLHSKFVKFHLYDLDVVKGKYCCRMCEEMAEELVYSDEE